MMILNTVASNQRTLIDMEEDKPLDRKETLEFCRSICTQLGGRWGELRLPEALLEPQNSAKLHRILARLDDAAEKGADAAREKGTCLADGTFNDSLYKKVLKDVATIIGR